MNLQLNAQRFTGKNYVHLYDKYRPTPPVEIIHQSLNYLNQAKAEQVIDVGCGTGLSTQVWADAAHSVIGVEPSAEMRAIASTKSQAHHVSYQEGYSNDLPFAHHSVDIVACSQSFHWMEPHSTLAEINRVLKDKGVLVIYDVIWPPAVNLEFEQAYQELFARVSELTATLDTAIAHRWPKQAHFTNVKDSSYFRLSKTAYFHKTERLTKEQFIGIALSQGGLEALLKRGFSEEEVGLSQFKEKIEAAKMPVYEEITYHYSVVFGIK